MLTAVTTLTGAAAFIYRNRALLTFKATLFYMLILNKLSSWDWWNKIDNHLYLGSIPLTTLGHDASLTEETGCTAVLSVIQPFELEHSSFFSTPVSTSTWQEKGISHQAVPMTDFQTAEPDQLHKAVCILEELLKKGHTVYVHCKAGIGRSATVVAAYLLKSGKAKSVEEALSIVLKKRKHIAIMPNQAQVLEGLKRYFQSYLTLPYSAACGS